MICRALVVGFLVVTTSGCGALLERSTTLRAIRWLDADMGDIHRFPRRDIGNRAPAFAFEAATESRYDSVFAPLTLKSEGEEDVVQDFEAFLEERDTYALLVVRRDTLLYERYFAERNRHSVETTFSVSKSLVSLATGIAIDSGWIASVHDPITTHLPELSQRDPRFGDLTVEHLLTMTSGIRFERGKSPWSDEAKSYYSPNLRSVAIGRDLTVTPGTRFLYNFYSPIVLGLALERASGRSISALLEQSVWSRIGATEPASWSMDSRHSGFEKMESGFNATAIDMAKLGRLYLREGDWDGERLLSADWVRASVRPDSTDGRASRYGYYWHLGADDQGRGAYWAEGRFGQFIYVAPEHGVVIVRTGRTSGDVGWPSVFARILKRIDVVDEFSPEPAGPTSPDGSRGPSTSGS